MHRYAALAIREWVKCKNTLMTPEIVRKNLISIGFPDFIDRSTNNEKPHRIVPMRLCRFGLDMR
jgi:hypothetical protein